jgi:hypothetical protein
MFLLRTLNAPQYSLVSTRFLPSQNVSSQLALSTYPANLVLRAQMTNLSADCVSGLLCQGSCVRGSAGSLAPDTGCGMAKLGAD